MKTTRIQIGTTMHIIIGTPEEVDAAVQALEDQQQAKCGSLVFVDEGRHVWFECHPVIDITKCGSSMYKWDKAGHKVRARLCRLEFTKGGPIDKRVIRAKWVNPLLY